MHLFSVLSFYALGHLVLAQTGSEKSGGFEVTINSETGEEYNLKLVKPGGSVLHDSVRYISIGSGDQNEKFRQVLVPSPQEKEFEKNIHLDEENLAVVHVQPIEGQQQINGVVNGMKIETASNGSYFVKRNAVANRTDYVDYGINLTYSKSSRLLTTNPKYTVEVLVFLDKELCDVFGHSSSKILEYITIYFWDVNVRYKTLRNLDISFLVTGIVGMSDAQSQPFIEEARAEDGRVEFGRILSRFSNWVYANNDTFPKFDMAVLMTNAAQEWYGGLAGWRAACRQSGSAVWDDNGAWLGITAGTHEMAHVLGALHDDESTGCPAAGYLMSPWVSDNEYQYFFSVCSEDEISYYVRSDQASCLTRLDETGVLPVTFAQPPTMEQVCQRAFGPTAYIKEEDTTNCLYLKCRDRNTNWINWWIPVDNTVCAGGGNCFRGRCLEKGVLIQNVASGQCLRKQDHFQSGGIIEMVECNRPGTPLDRFMIRESEYDLGKMLCTPYQDLNATENGDACIWTGVSNGNWMSLDVYTVRNGWHGWDFIALRNGEIIISHRITGRCARQKGNIVETLLNCDINDSTMKWRLLD